MPNTESATPRMAWIPLFTQHDGTEWSMFQDGTISANDGGGPFVEFTKEDTIKFCQWIDGRPESFARNPELTTANARVKELEKERDKNKLSALIAIEDNEALRSELREDGAKWQPIETFDYTKMDFVLVCQDGAVRLRLWNAHRTCWERADGMEPVQPHDECPNPTHWMECPSAIDTARKTEAP